MSVTKNQLGQASLEYILFIAIAVAVVLGGIYQLNSAARVFADNYFGDYLTCLLETGELPSLGGTEQGQCDREFKKFNLADGRSPLPGVGQGDGKNGSEDDPNSAKAGSGSDAGGGGGGTAESGGDNSGGRFGAPAFSKSGTRTRIKGGAGESDEDQNQIGSSSAGSAFKDGYDNSKVTRFPVRNMSGSSGGRRRAEEKEQKLTKVTSPTKDGGAEAGRPVRFKARSISSTIIPEEEAMDLGLGAWLRYLIIIIIILAIVVFIGGQAFQYSKEN